MSYSLPHGEVRSSDLYYQKKSHGDAVFQDKFFEKLYMWNDGCDGKIWEKEHSGGILTFTTYYPGSYASTSYHLTLIHPNEANDDGDRREGELPGNKRCPYVSNGFDIAGGRDCVYARTSSFVLCANIMAVAGISQKYNAYRVSKDGVHWTPWQGNIPAQWANAGGWSTDSDEGITCGKDPEGKNGFWHLTIDEDGIIHKELVATIGEQRGEHTVIESGTFIGDIATQGIETTTEIIIDDQGHEKTVIHKYYKFIEKTGIVYTSALPATYQYIDMHDSDPEKQVKTGNYDWRFFYYDGKYIAASMRTKMIYYNTEKREWQTIRNFVIMVSESQFNSVEKNEYDQCPTNEFTDWTIWHFGGQPIIMEHGYDMDGGTRVNYMAFRYLDFTYMFKIGGNDKRVRMPFIGRSIDGSYDALDLYYVNPKAEEDRICVRSFSFDGCKRAVYIDEHGPTNPGGYIVIPTAFRKNGWSSNSYDVGGFIFLDISSGDFMRPTGAYAWCSDNKMIDRDNATWGQDYHRIFARENGQGFGLGLDVTEQRRHYLGDFHLDAGVDDFHSKYYYFHLKHIIYPCIVTATEEGYVKTPLYQHRRLLRHFKTVFDLTDHHFNVNSPYYFPQAGIFSSFYGRDFARVDYPSNAYWGETSASSAAYCFAVHYLYLQYSQYTRHAIAPLVIGEDEFAVLYSPGGTDYANVKMIEYDGLTWYYRGFSYGFTGNDDTAARYIDVSYLGTSATQDQIALECLKIAHTGQSEVNQNA